uniref:Uncharacterized protein n=1 Tax=Rousettus aegyptiacus TaxID=9407 RepID=A0A7J8DI63_ROUAE|nr:hypothetical protein HJG63_008601 [Rousettus aegyptiacus]
MNLGRKTLRTGFSAASVWHRRSRALRLAGPRGQEHWRFSDNRCGHMSSGVLICLATLTKYHRLGGFNNRHLLFHSAGGWKSKIKMSAGFILSEASPQFADGHLLTVSFPLCMPTPRVTLCAPISSSYRGTSQVGLEPTLMASF